MGQLNSITQCNMKICVEEFKNITLLTIFFLITIEKGCVTFIKNFVRILIIIIVVLLIICAVIFLKPVKINYGKSDAYTEEEIKAAIDVVKERFEDYQGSKLFSLSYAGDEYSLRKTSYNLDYEYTIVVKTIFLSSSVKKGSWDAHKIYNWNFILVRNEDEDWKLLTWGY